MIGAGRRRAEERANMSRYRTLATIICVPLFWLAAPNAYGQATRTWVSGVGDDANPCSRTAPCKTFAGAISKTAPAGEINVLDPGGFGAVTITKSISIEATEGIAGVLVSGTNGINISAGPTDTVVLRGLTINGLGSGLKGIAVMSAGTVIIEDCFITEFTPRGISIEPTSGNVQVFISNTKIQANTSNGITVVPTIPYVANVTLDNVSIVDNVNFGLSVHAGGSVVVRNSSIAENAAGTPYTNVTVDATGGAASVLLDNVNISGGPTGILAAAGATVRVNNSSITGNTTGVSTLSGAQILSFGNNRLSGNGSDGAFSGVIPLL
jgi:Right handed beta helix region